MLYWVLKWFLFVPVIRLVFRPWIEGKHNVPATGPAILVANHISAGDTYLLPALISRRLVFPAKSEAFTGTGLRGAVLRWFLVNVGMLPMDRSAGAGNDREVLRWVTDEIMAAVQELSGQTYVDAYASSVKSAAAEGRSFETKVLERPGGRPAPPAPAPVPPTASDVTP